MPTGDKKFRRVEVTVGQTLANNTQEIVSGLQPGQQVIHDALVFQNTVGQ
jgi:cobalt-zinc-cadmium efflux system membrane fusion protein